ncbi:MAG: 4-hydroxythreonine-4-phosphate dehydrogenase PdxA [Candidatus Kapabacteria bacterium]|nr:4-hydroxythreonine-4-phosphate dehydrogenase PdxA [Candidatus Kapabacteria bacterium]
MKIIVSIGDCNGIGLETFYKAVQKLSLNKALDKKIHLTLAGNKKTIKEYFKKLNYEIKDTKEGILIENKEIDVIDLSFYSPVDFGKITEKSAKLTIEALDYSVNAVINKNFDAIVTLPINKYALQSVGWNFPGHTEFLAEKTQSNSYMMILMTRKLRVALVTTHIPLSDVSKKINQKLIKNKAKIFYHTLEQDFSIKKPKIAVLGLNPHAGENGAIGKEENRIIQPAIDKLNSEGNSYYGPFPADGFFAHNDYKNYDGILAMYHDQGLIPLKLLAGNKGVNFTANLPIVRTSPDHGTAFQIAGKGIASGDSTFEAIRMAYLISKRRNNL